MNKLFPCFHYQTVVSHEIGTHLAVSAGNADVDNYSGEIPRLRFSTNTEQISASELHLIAIIAACARVLPEVAEFRGFRLSSRHLEWIAFRCFDVRLAPHVISREIA